MREVPGGLRFAGVPGGSRFAGVPGGSPCIFLFSKSVENKKPGACAL